MTRRDPLVLDRRLEPIDLRWLRTDEAAVRAYRAMKVARYRNKVYLCFGPVEIQYGRVSGSIAVFRRRPWRRLLVIEGPWLLAAFGLASLALALLWRWPA